MPMQLKVVRYELCEVLPPFSTDDDLAYLQSWCRCDAMVADGTWCALPRGTRARLVDGPGHLHTVVARFDGPLLLRLGPAEQHRRQADTLAAIADWAQERGTGMASVEILDGLRQAVSISLIPLPDLDDALCADFLLRFSQTQTPPLPVRRSRACSTG